MITKNHSEEQEKLDRFAKAIWHPARISIFHQECCFFDDLHEELPIAETTVSKYLKKLKEAGIIRGDIETPKIKYYIKKGNWEREKKMFADFICQPIYKKENCCN